MMETRASRVLAFGALLIGLTGCSAKVSIHPAGGDTVMICISQIDRSGGGAPGSGLPVGTRPPAASQPETDPRLPSPEAPTPPPRGTSPQAQNAPGAPGSSTAQTATAELQSRYGIRIVGNPTPTSIDQVVYTARQLHPQDTQGLTIDFVDQGAGAVLGQWAWNGRTAVITVFGPAKESISTIYHEILHHVTNGRPSNIGYGVARRVSQQLGGMEPRAYPRSMITGSYALTSVAEFWAELFSAHRLQAAGLLASDRFSMVGPWFDPPANVVATMNPLYADGGTGP
jgi:hypothetical protein